MIQEKNVYIPYKLVSAEKGNQMVDPTAQWFCIYCPPPKAKRVLKDHINMIILEKRKIHTLRRQVSF